MSHVLVPQEDGVRAGDDNDVYIAVSPWERALPPDAGHRYALQSGR